MGRPSPQFPTGTLFQKTVYFSICVPASDLAQRFLKIRVSYRKELRSGTQKQTASQQVASRMHLRVIINHDKLNYDQHHNLESNFNFADIFPWLSRFTPRFSAFSRLMVHIVDLSKTLMNTRLSSRLRISRQYCLTSAVYQ